jgi:hypothetical protein
MTTSSSEDDWLARIERAIRRDPAHRGLLSAPGEPLVPGHLASAADHLARFAQRVWILTGFYIPAADPPAAETDGPPGAAALAACLAGAGAEPWLLTDAPCASAVRRAAMLYGLPEDRVLVCPSVAEELEPWALTCDELSSLPLTHLIALERVGPAHTPASWSDPAISTAFRDRVPTEHWNRCHNMRGVILDDVTLPLHRAWEWVVATKLGCRTIGIGDGGNEIGLGAVPYGELRRRLAEPAASLIPCRLAADWTILAGVSNWGGQALGAAVCHLRGHNDVWRALTQDREESRLIALVDQGPAVDGVTRRREPTVDGLPFLTYIQPWMTVREILEEQVSLATDTDPTSPHPSHGPPTTDHGHPG